MNFPSGAFPNISAHKVPYLPRQLEVPLATGTLPGGLPYTALMSVPQGVFSFRFSQAAVAGLVDLFAVGHQDIQDPAYSWDGLGRADGPLVLFQHTLAGGGILEKEGRSWRVGPGHGFLVTIPSPHVYRIDPEVGRWELLFVLARPGGIETLWRSTAGRIPAVVELARSSPPIRRLEELVAAAAHGQVTDAHTASLFTYGFLVALSRFSLDPRPRRVPGAVDQAVRLLDHGWNRPWKLPEVAARVGLSPSHFHRMFREHTGLSPLEWLTRRRMEKAVELLGEPGVTVQSVARALGFADTGYFIRVFHRWTGVTPGVLRDSPSAWKGSKIVLSSGEFSDSQASAAGVESSHESTRRTHPAPGME